MIDVIGVLLDSGKDIYYVSPNNLKISKGQIVVVEMNQDIQLGETITNIISQKKENLDLPLNKVSRIATKDDLMRRELLEQESAEALLVAKKFAEDLDLDMHFVDAHYTYEKRQLFFNFVADSRVDFRELAKKLAQKYKTRIELRQIGVRDKAKKIGGLGPCGLFLCCNTFLTDFNSVSINMAKNQMLALNPTKINGVCGRLLCCINYEDETYSFLKQGLPQIGMEVQKEEGTGKVVGVNLFKRSYQVDFGPKGIVEFYEEQ